MKCRPEIGIQFLRWLYPHGPWAITAIDRERIEPLVTRTFSPRSEDEFIDWLNRYNDGKQWNIYYHVNKPTHNLNKKAEREDIAEMCYLHVDVDPRVGEKLEEEHTRIKKLLTENLPPGIPKPSALIFSGGGYNALWKLNASIPIHTDNLTRDEILVRAEDAKRWNLQLEIVLGGDNCHNIDRILRVPGTINWPDPKKRSKGRVPALADIIDLRDEEYDISKFVAASPIQKSGVTSLHNGTEVRISGNVPRLGHVSELGDTVPPKTKMIIVQGRDPDEPNKFGSSRSEWLFYVCCELIRAGIKDEIIYSVITDPGFKISESVLDKGSSTQRYALRQIQRAKEVAIDPKLCEMNDKFWIIGNTGGKCRVFEEIDDHSLDRRQLVMQTFEDFRNRFGNELVKIGEGKKGPILVPLGEWWLRHPKRRQYSYMTFLPGREIPDTYNMWCGFSCEAKPGNKHEIFLHHLKEHICGGNEIYYTYTLGWMARAVQHPDKQGEVAIVLRGDPGIGKGAIVREFGKLWGRHFLQISDPKHLVGSFNIHLRDAVIVFADEAFYAGDRKHESILKTLITEYLIALEGKFVNVETGRNYVHLILASNKKWVIPAELHERRYLVLDVKPDKMNDKVYWEEFYTSMDSGGRENLLHYLLTLDISKYDVRRVPQTEGLREQKLLSLTSEQEWWFSKLQSGRLTQTHSKWTGPILRDDLFDDYIAYAQKLGIPRRSTITALGKFLHSVVPGELQSRQISIRREDGSKGYDRPYAYFFPEVDTCRKFWDEKFSGPYSWDMTHISEDNDESIQQDAFGSNQ